MQTRNSHKYMVGFWTSYWTVFIACRVGNSSLSVVSPMNQASLIALTSPEMGIRIVVKYDCLNYYYSRC